MPNSPDSDEAQTGGELVERLLARTVNVGVIDVGRVQRQYARTADWVAERFAVLGDINARYGSADASAARSASSLPVAPGRYARAESETESGQEDQATAVGDTPSAPELGTTPGGVGGVEAPTLQRKAAGPGSAPASATAPESATARTETAAAPLETSAPLVAEESRLALAEAPPSLMTLAAENSASGLDASPPGAAHAPGGEAAASTSTEPLAREAAPPVSVKPDAAVQPTFAPANSLAVEPAAPSPAAEAPSGRLPLAREESPRTASDPMPTLMRSPLGGASPPQIQRATIDGGDATDGLAADTASGGDNASSPSERPLAAAPASQGHAAVTSPAEGQTPKPAAPAQVMRRAAEARTRTRLSTPEISQGASLPLAARMVWRKSADGGAASAGAADSAGASAPYALPTLSHSPGSPTQTLYRASSSTPALARAASDGESAETPAPAQPNGGGVSLEQITEHVSRVILRRLAVERERRGQRRWL